MTDIERTHLSRFQAVCSERPAWARPALRRKGHYYFDGRCFWLRPESGRERLLPSWRAPRYGWLHESGCDCGLCALQGAGTRRAA